MLTNKQKPPDEHAEKGKEKLKQIQDNSFLKNGKKKNVASIMLLLSLDGGGVIILPVWHMFLTPILGH
jgi:hypothetical protein